VGQGSAIALDLAGKLFTGAAIGVGFAISRVRGLTSRTFRTRSFVHMTALRRVLI
jgi:hypothetical protein